MRVSLLRALSKSKKQGSNFKIYQFSK